jgi:hypothetical protein
MRTLSIIAVTALIAALSLTGCGGGGTPAPVATDFANYVVAPPVTLSPKGTVLVDGQSSLTLQFMELQVVFDGVYRGGAPGLRLIVKDHRGITHDLVARDIQRGELINAYLFGQGDVSKAFVCGIFSRQHYHFTGTITLHFANGAAYSMPVDTDATL